MVNRQIHRRRAGFTLVEVLTVVIIIGILMGMLFVAFGRAMIAARNAAMKNEVTQIVQAISNMQTQLGGNENPPDLTNTQDFQRYLRGVFPRCNPALLPISFSTTASTTTPTADPNGPCDGLVLWLGGAQDSTGKFIGLSADPTNPFDCVPKSGGSSVPSASRIGPFYDFDKNRLLTFPIASLNFNTTALSNAGFSAPTTSFKLFWFFPPNGKPVPTASGNGVAAGSVSPYLYYKAVANTYPAYASCWVDPNKVNIQPFVTAQATTSPVAAAVYVNPTSYQLLCPGLDGNYSFGGKQTTGTNSPPLPPLYPSGTNYTTAVQDDITNFSSSTVGNDKP